MFSLVLSCISFRAAQSFLLSSSVSGGRACSRSTVFYRHRSMSTIPHAMMDRIYGAESDASYNNIVSRIFTINKHLRADGILAPTDVSFANVSTLYKAIGCPLDEIPVFHVGGTNGKGSTSFKLATALQSAGLRTGLFVSPHISSLRERWQVNQELIAETDFIRYARRILALCVEQGIPLTEFEVLFLLGTLHFQQSRCEAVVLEVGMGGEVDATNVVQTDMSVLCSVGFDHVKALGPTLDDICDKKAGIFRRNVPALIGPSVPVTVAEAKARERGAPLYTYAQCLREFGSIVLETGLLTEVQVQSQSVPADTDQLNTLLSFFALQLYRRHHSDHISGQIDHWLSSTEKREVVYQSLTVRPPCRWEKHRVTLSPSHPSFIDVVLDMGHNPAAIEALVERTKREYGEHLSRIWLVCGMMRDKDVSLCLQSLATIVSPSQMMFLQAQHPRACRSQDLADMMQAALLSERGITIEATAATTEEEARDKNKLSVSAVQTTDEETSFRLLLDHLHQSLLPQTDSTTEGEPGAVIIVCGSGYIMPGIRSVLGIVEPRDSVLH